MIYVIKVIWLLIIKCLFQIVILKKVAFCRFDKGMMSRTVPRRVARLLFVLSLFVAVVYVRASGYLGETDDEEGESVDDPASIDVRSINCIVNRNTTVPCKQVNTEVYVPFRFLSEYFELYGKLTTKGGDDVFNFDHSFGNVKSPVENYNPLGVHADDVYYYVEGRAKVLYISGKEGVPVCMSWWNLNGFFFSTNIGQFGLAHYSKAKIEKNRVFVKVDDAGSSQSSWKTSGGDSVVSVVKDESLNINVLEFKTPDDLDQPGLVYDVQDEDKKALELLTYIKFSSPGSITVVVDTTDGKTYKLTYVTTDDIVRPYIENDRMMQGIGRREEWGRVTRNLDLDLHKALLLDAKTKLGSVRLEESSKIIKNVRQLVIRGSGRAANFTFSNTAHMEHFMDVADWMLENMDDKGGWAINSTRVLGTSTIHPGWYSALGQGVGISVLVRAYGLTHEERYIDGALKGSGVFHTLAKDGGVKAVFLNKYDWYEEYPTVPPSFVLNGFVTAMFGLYDLAKVATPPRNEDAQKLFDNGMISLKALLPLFDGGSRTFYDLKHFTMRITPNIARWDYHNLHVELLMHMSTIDSDPIFKIMAKRWDGYKKGIVSPHN